MLTLVCFFTGLASSEGCETSVADEPLGERRRDTQAKYSRKIVGKMYMNRSSCRGKPEECTPVPENLKFKQGECGRCEAAGALSLPHHHHSAVIVLLHRTTQSQWKPGGALEF